MKRIRLLIINTVIVISLLFVGCGGLGAPKIEDHEMKMNSVLRREGDELITVAVGKADPAYPEAEVLDLTLKASGGTVSVRDDTGARSYEGSYALKSKKAETAIYDLTLEGATGYAVVTVTKYADGSKISTLVAEIGGYSLYFYPKT